MSLKSAGQSASRLDRFLKSRRGHRCRGRPRGLLSTVSRRTLSVAWPSR
ncbi:hypothetical protein [Pseudomonas fluorescens]|nr:hypothetical protein [Pseudomonas fluorescens]